MMTKTLPREDLSEVVGKEGVTVMIEEVVLEIDTRVDTITCMKTLVQQSNMLVTTNNLAKTETDEDSTQEEVTTTLLFKQAREKEEALEDHTTTINKILDILTTITTMNKIMIITIDNIDIQELNNTCSTPTMEDKLQ